MIIPVICLLFGMLWAFSWLFTNGMEWWIAMELPQGFLSMFILFGGCFFIVVIGAVICFALMFALLSASEPSGTKVDTTPYLVMQNWTPKARGAYRTHTNHMRPKERLAYDTYVNHHPDQALKELTRF